MDFVKIIQHFQEINGIMIKNLSDTSINMIYYIILIDLTLTFLFIEEEGLNIFLKLMRKILVYGFFIYMIKNFTEIVDTILHGFIQLGNLASTGNASTTLLVSPGEVFSDLMAFITGILTLSGSTVGLDFIPVVSIESVPTAVLIFTFFLALGALFIGIEITVIFIKFFIVTATSIILMPFGAFQKTQDISIKGLHALFAQGIEIMFVTIILNFYKKYKTHVLLPEMPIDNPTMLDVIENIGIMLLFCIMISKIPIFVSTLLSGSISSLGVTNSANKKGIARNTTGKLQNMSSTMSNAMNSYAKSGGGINESESSLSYKK